MTETTTLNLDGTWLIRSDPGNTGLAESWYANQVENITQWQACKVPGAWQNTIGTDYHYLAWYRRTVCIPENWSKYSRSWLRFQAAATQARIWICGNYVGSHTGDYLPFEFEVTDFIQPGKSLELVIRVDEMPGHITKGFHDMVSLHHGGIWQPVTIIGTGDIHIPRESIAIVPDPETHNVTVRFASASFDDHLIGLGSGGLLIKARITDNNNDTVAQTKSVSGAANPNNDVVFTLNVVDPMLWSPADPYLYEVEIEIIDSSQNTVSETYNFLFGFRRVTVSDKHLLLNGNPIHIRGILHWGHDPEHIAPSPAPQEVREEFSRLREMGFNCVCLCMWYPPEYYYEIADETGMLIWQEHPVWHSPMDAEYLPEYRRLYTEFIKRDSKHTSVIIVSATCEHPCFDKDLAKWWWETAKRELPNRALQVQTSSFAWSDPEQTDLYDEHTYDNNNRWTHYLCDLQQFLKEQMPASKPFIMGESVLFTSWPDLSAIKNESAASDSGKPWWAPKYFESGLNFEYMLVDKYGNNAAQRFRQQADEYHIQGRKFQIEQFRAYENHAGLVMNHIRDVALCTCGFMDDFNRWRFSPEQTNTWLADTVLFLETPDNRRSFYFRESVSVQIGISNFSGSGIHDKVVLELGAYNPDSLLSSSSLLMGGNWPGSNYETEDVIDCEPGAVNRGGFELMLPGVDTDNSLSSSPNGNNGNIKRLAVRAVIGECVSNRWDLWVFPRLSFATISGTYRLTGLPYSVDDYAPDDVERGYSRGFGLPAKSWISTLPDTAVLLPAIPAWQHDKPIPAGARVIITHKLTDNLVDFMVNDGGRVIVLASKTAGGIGTRYEWLFGGCPLVIERGPISENDSKWIIGLLGFDLTSTYCRIMPTADSGLSDNYIDPLIRLVYTHNQSRVQIYDFMWMSHVGCKKGLLLVSSLDHSLPAGQYLLHSMIEFVNSDNAQAAAEIPVEFLQGFVHNTNKP